MNKVLLHGKLGRDPELKYTKEGIAVCRMAVATNEKYKNSSGADTEKTTWHQIVVFKKLAELCQTSLVKGDGVFIEGKIDNSVYEKNGEKRYNSQILAEKVTFLKKPEFGNDPNAQAGNSKFQGAVNQIKETFQTEDVYYTCNDIPF